MCAVADAQTAKPSLFDLETSGSQAKVADRLVNELREHPVYSNKGWN